MTDLDPDLDFDFDPTRILATIRITRLDLDPRRRVSNVTLGFNDSVVETALEFDSHDNTCVLGRHAIIILDYNRPVSIVVYDKSLGTHTYKTVSGVITYTDPKTRRKLHL
jgi:hypothetical protein